MNTVIKGTKTIAEYKRVREDMENLARANYARHKEAFEEWGEGEPVKAWFDFEGNFCIEYESGKWWHYNDNRAKAAMQNRGAKERAEEVKAAFLEAAKQIPADQRQEILDRMGQQKEIPTMGRLQYYQAEAEARRQLDTALKQEAQTRERNRTHDRDRGI